MLGAHIAIYKERKPSFAKECVAKRCQHGGTAETLDARQKRQRTERSSQGGSSSHLWQREPVREPVESTENRSNFNSKSTKTLPWTGLCGAMGDLDWQVGGQGRLWQVLDPPNPPDGAVLSPSWNRVGAKLKYFGVERVILEVLKSKVATGIDFRRFLKPCREA